MLNTNVSASAADALARVYSQSPKLPVTVTIGAGITASVVISGRSAPDAAWVPLATVSASGITQLDFIKYLKVDVTITAGGGGASTVQVTAPYSAERIERSSPSFTAPPVNTERPKLTGTMAVGQTLTGTDGGWGNSPTGFTRRILRQGRVMSTTSTYTLTAADMQFDFEYEVVATNAGGSSRPVRSLPTEALGTAREFVYVPWGTKLGFGRPSTPIVIPTPEPTYTMAYAIAADAGAIQGFPAGMSTTAGSGPYWPNLLDMRGFPGWDFDWALWYSPDHSSDAGGIFLSVAKGDPTVAANWRTYNEAVAQGGFAAITSKPAANPLFAGGAAGFTSVETPCVVRVGDTLVMTFHVNNSTGGLSYQETYRATSTDGVNWTVPTTRNAALLRAYATDAPGDGHTGYFTWAVNPFVDLINPTTGQPWKYVGYSLFGGGDRALAMQWGCDEPIAGAWRKLQPLMLAVGRASAAADGLGMIPNEYHAGSLRALGNGRYSILTAASTVGVSGAAARTSSIYEIVLDKLGRRIIAKPKRVLAPKAGTFSAAEVAQPFLHRDTALNRFLLAYSGTDASNKNKIGIASGPLVDPAVTAYEPLVPDLSAGTWTEFSFRNTTTMPAGISLLLTGTPAATISEFISSPAGIQLSTRNGPDMSSEAVLSTEASFVPADHDYIDMYVDRLRENHGSMTWRRVSFGFTSAKVALNAMTDALYFQNTRADGVTAITGGTMRSRVGGVEQTPVGSERWPGFGDQSSGFWTAETSFGVRWYPQLGKAYLLGAGGNELEEMPVPAGLSLTTPVYPFLSLRTTSNQYNSFERIGALVVGSKRR